MKRNRDRKKTERPKAMVKPLNSVPNKHAKEEAMANEPKKIQIIDDASVRELYANKLVSASFDGGAVVITLGVTRFVPEDSTQAPAEGIRLPVHVTGRLAVSPSGAVELANALNNMLKTLRELQQKAATAKAS